MCPESANLSADQLKAYLRHIHINQIDELLTSDFVANVRNFYRKNGIISDYLAKTHKIHIRLCFISSMELLYANLALLNQSERSYLRFLIEQKTFSLLNCPDYEAVFHFVQKEKELQNAETLCYASGKYLNFF